MELVRVPEKADPAKVRQELERRLKRKPTEYELNKAMEQQAEYREKIRKYRQRQERALKAKEEGKLFVKGGVPGPGRPPKVVESGALALLKSHLDTDELLQLLDDWIEIAREKKEWRGIAEYIKLRVAYEEGLPQKRTKNEGGGNVFIDKMVQIVRENEGGRIYGDDDDGPAGRSGGDVSDGEYKLLSDGDGGGVLPGDEDPGG